MGLTVRDYIIRSNNPQTKLATEDYAVAVGQGFYWYSAELAARNVKNENVLCFPDKTVLGRSTILQAANRATGYSNGNASFEQALLHALAEIFSCR